MDVSSDYQLLWSTVEVRRFSDCAVRKTTTGDQLRAGLLRMPRNRDTEWYQSEALSAVISAAMSGGSAGQESERAYQAARLSTTTRS